MGKTVGSIKLPWNRPGNYTEEITFRLGIGERRNKTIFRTAETIYAYIDKHEKNHKFTKLVAEKGKWEGDRKRWLKKNLMSKDFIA